MKTIVITLLLFLFFTNSALAERKNVDLGWSSRGLSVDFPKYKYGSRMLKSEYNKTLKTPKNMTRQGFRDIDKSINKTVSRKINKWFN